MCLESTQYSLRAAFRIELKGQKQYSVNGLGGVACSPREISFRSLLVLTENEIATVSFN